MLVANMAVPVKCCLILQIRRSDVTVMQQSCLFPFLDTKRGKASEALGLANGILVSRTSGATAEGGG